MITLLEIKKYIKTINDYLDDAIAQNDIAEIDFLKKLKKQAEEIKINIGRERLLFEKFVGMMDMQKTLSRGGAWPRNN